MVEAVMALHRATAELRACSGTQFDPRVVEAVITVLGEDEDDEGDAELAAAA